MSRHYHEDIATLGQCRDNVSTLGKLLELVSRHCYRCCDIEEFSSFKKKIFTCFPHFIYAISVHACEYKSINIEESQFKKEYYCNTPIPGVLLITSQLAETCGY